MDEDILNQELKMIARGDHVEIMAYIAEACIADESFDTDAQIALIKRGNHEEIMACFRTNKYPLSPKTKQALIERGNIEEIKLIKA